MNYTLRPMEERHLDDVADIHIAVFQDDFITSLGRRFVRDVYYEYIVKTETAVGIVCEDQERAVGFIVGAYGSKKLYRELVKEFWFKILISVFLVVLQQPRIVMDILRTLNVMKDDYGEFEEESELYQIAVAENYRGKGLGRMLAVAFFNDLCNAGVYSCWTKTHSLEAAKFYETIGFYRVSSFTLHGKTNFVFSRKIGRPCI